MTPASHPINQKREFPALVVELLDTVRRLRQESKDCLQGPGRTQYYVVVGIFTCKNKLLRLAMLSEHLCVSQARLLSGVDLKS